jgi:two-component system OmpR family response regulator
MQPAYKASVKQRLSVLIVEDENLLAKATSRFLQLNDYRTEICANGSLALKRLKDGAFDALVTDIGIPGTSGEVLVEWCVEAAGLQRIVVISGSDHVRISARGTRGRVKFLRKPFDFADLLLCLSGMRARPDVSVGG